MSVRPITSRPSAPARIDMTIALRSPGSALKPFIYALAFENGIAHPETMLDDRPSRFGVYAPENFDLTFQGTVTARTALQQSLNMPAVELLAEVGPARLLARLRNAGAQPVLPDERAGPRHRPRRPRRHARRSRAALRRPCARRRRARLVERLDLPRPRRARAARYREPVACWYVSDVLPARRRPPTRRPARSPTRPARPTATATLGGRLRQRA